MKKLILIALLMELFILSGCMENGEQKENVKDEENKQQDKVSREQKDKDSKNQGKKEDNKQDKFSKKQQNQKKKTYGNNKAGTISKDEFLNAAEKGEKQKVKSYIQGGGDINAKDDDGETALMYASIRGNKKIAKLLIENGADINAKNKVGRTALMYASIRGNKEIAKLLIENGADINSKGKQGMTSLFLASIKGNKDIAKSLIENGADINAQTKNGGTALMIANKKGNKEVARILIENGADINAKDKYGNKASRNASKEGNKDISNSDSKKSTSSVNGNSKSFSKVSSGNIELITYNPSKLSGSDVDSLSWNNYLSGGGSPSACTFCSSGGEDPSLKFGCYGTNLNGAESKINGEQNTKDIVNYCSNSNIAAKFCNELTIKGKSDWYLPSKNELNILIENISKTGDKWGTYWSSTEIGNSKAWSQNISKGRQKHSYKNNRTKTVRCVRNTD